MYLNREEYGVKSNYDTSLHEKIDSLRQKLESLILENNFKQSDEIVQVSQKLDKLIIIYYNQKCG